MRYYEFASALAGESKLTCKPRLLDYLDALLADAVG